jgi:hypothetical protein
LEDTPKRVLDMLTGAACACDGTSEVFSGLGALRDTACGWDRGTHNGLLLLAACGWITGPDSGGGGLPRVAACV